MLRVASLDAEANDREANANLSEDPAISSDGLHGLPGATHLSVVEEDQRK